MTRRSLLTAATTTAAAATAPLLALQNQRRPPNIVVILADDLGIGDLSCYGGADVRTPNIDALAASGLRWENFYANSTVCSPTRAALMTGCYPDRVGVPGVIRTFAQDNWGYLSTAATTLPQALTGGSGYHTAIVGKWHLGLESPNTPTERGFHHFHGFLGDMMDDYVNHRRHGNNYLRLDRQEIDPPGHATDLFTRWACDYVDSRKAQAAPFFLYLAYNAPHSPIQPTEASLAKVRARDPQMTDKRAKLVALVEHMDEGVGQLVARLRENGQLDQTLVIFSSDNGGELASGGTCGPWRGGKQDMYEGGLRVPCLMSWPGQIRAGSRTKARAMTMDLFATACQAGGVKALPAGLDGQSLLAVARGEREALADRDMIFVRREGNQRYQGRDYYALRRGDWKLLQNSPFEPYQLFHLGEDPGESRDRAKDQPVLYRELSLALARHIQRAGRTAWQRG